MRPDTDEAPVPLAQVFTGASVRAQLQTLRGLSASFDQVATECSQAARTLGSVQWHLPARAAVLSPVTALRCESAAHQAVSGPHALTWLERRAHTIAALLTSSADAYDAAEATAGRLMTKEQQAYSTTVALRSLLLALEAARDGGLANAGANLMDDVPEVTDAITALIDARIPGSYEQNMGMFASATRMLRAPGVLRVSGVETSTASKFSPSVTSVSDSFARVGALYDSPSDRAYVQVQRSVDPATGRGTWLVLIPGTEGGVGGANPFCWLSNLELSSGRDSDSSKAVEEALERAMSQEGTNSRSDPVMLVGHSQGGMIAAFLAAKFTRSKKANVTHVATFGAPVGRVRTPAGVQMLNVEKRQDLVPRTDAWASGDGESQRIRVVMDDPNATSKANGKRGAITAHDAQRYASSYRSWRGSQQSNSVVGQYETSARPFFSGVKKSYTFSATRVPNPGASSVPSSPQPAPAADPNVRYGVPSYAYDRPRQ